MASLPLAGSARLPILAGMTPRRLLRALLPALSLSLILIGIAWLNVANTGSMIAGILRAIARSRVR